MFLISTHLFFDMRSIFLGSVNVYDRSLVIGVYFQRIIAMGVDNGLGTSVQRRRQKFSKERLGENDGMPPAVLITGHHDQFSGFIKAVNHQVDQIRVDIRVIDQMNQDSIHALCVVTGFDAANRCGQRG